MSLAASLLRPISRAALALALVTLVSWTLVECAPSSTARRAAEASRAFALSDTQLAPAHQSEIVAAVAKRHGLEGGFLPHLAARLAGAFRLDFGNSWQDGLPVAQQVLGPAGRLTLGLCVSALWLALLIGTAAAIASARRPGSRTDSIWALLSSVMLCLPLPWFAMAAIATLAYGHPLAVFPPGGFSGIAHAILPIVVLASAPVAVVWRHARSEMLSIAQRPWVLAAQARGTGQGKLWWRHILKAASPALLALLPSLLAYLFAASVVVERVFAIHGLGDRIARAAQAGDAPVLIAAATVAVVTISLSTSLVDWASGRIDPRRKLQP